MVSYLPTVGYLDCFWVFVIIHTFTMDFFSQKWDNLLKDVISFISFVCYYQMSF